jgi:phosphatidylserine synthase
MDKKIFDYLLAAGAILILISSVLVMENILWGKYAFAAGSLFYIISRLKMKYEGDDFRLKRFNRNIYISSLLLAGTCYLQFKGTNIWVVLLFMAALLELYSTFRISAIEKEK